MVQNSEQNSGDRREGDEQAATWDKSGSGPDEDVVFFDEDEMSLQWSQWRPGSEYVEPMRDARSAEALLRRWLRRVPSVGTQVRTFARCTPEGEPVTSLAMHPDAWRYLAALAADGEEYRRMVAERGPEPESDETSGEASGRWWHEYRPRAWAAALAR